MILRAGVAILLVSFVGVAASSSVCDRFRQSDLIFIGSADSTWITLLDTHKSPVHKRSEKSKRIRFLAREWYKGQHHDMVEIWMTPSDCALDIQANQMYLIYAHVNKDNGRTESNGCMGTEPVTKANTDLTYLGAALRGPGAATEISGMAGHEGVAVQAVSGMNTRWAIADSAGHYTLDGLAPGDWKLSVNGGAAKDVQLAPDSCMTEDLQP